MDNSSSGIDQSTLNNVLGGSGGGSLFPESLATAMAVSFVVLNIIGLIFLAAYIANAIRNWKVQTAVFHMQKDLAEIKASLASPEPSEPKVKPTAPQTPPQPGDSSRMVAATEDDQPDTQA